MHNLTQALILDWLKANGLGLAIATGLMLAFLAASLRPLFLPAPGPILSQTPVSGVIASFSVPPVNPEHNVGRSYRYRYWVRLNGSSQVVRAHDDVDSFHPVGSTVFLEEATYGDGSKGYRFLHAKRS